MLFAVLVCAMIASLHLGVRQNTPAEVWQAIVAYGSDQTSLVIRTLRLPRMLTAPLVGAALGVAGLLLQTTSRNPLASPTLLGVNAGAAFAVVLALSVFNISAIAALSVVACLGALAAIGLVLAISVSAGGGMTPTTTLLAGVTLGALMTSGTQIILVTDETTMESLIFWLSGGFADRGMEFLPLGAPTILVAIGAAFLMHRTLDVLMADDASAAAMGVPVMQIRFGALALAAILTGVSVILAGPVAFVGLVAPHIARRIGGLRHQATIPLVALTGACLAMIADILARFVIYPSEAPISTVLAFVGVPVLVMLLRAPRGARGLQ